MKNRNTIVGGLVLIILLHLLVLSQLIFFPYPELFIYPYLTNNGLLPYKQIFDQHFPGLFFLPVNLNNLGMVTPEIARIWLYTIVVLTHLGIFWAGKNIFKQSRWIFLSNALYIVWQPFFAGWSLWIDSFLPLIVLPSFVLTKKYFDLKHKKLTYLFAIGLLIGGGIVLKQVLIPLAAFLGIYLLFKRLSVKEIGVYSLGVLVLPVIMIIYLVSMGIWGDFWYWTVVYNLTIYAEYGRKSAPAIGFLTRVALVFMTPLLMFLSKDKQLVHILGLFLIGGLICVYGRFDFIYFQTAIPLAILAFVYGLSQIRNKIFQLGILAVYILIASWWGYIFLKGHLGHSVLSFDTQTVQLAAKVEQYTHYHDKTFFLGTSPHMYQITQTLPAGNVYVFQFPWFYLVAEGRILDGIKQDRPQIVVVDDQAIIEDKKVQEFASQVYSYLMQNYHQIDMVGTAKILSLNEK